MAHAQDNYIAWLRNAHAMEEHSVIMLTAQAKRIENYPDLKARIEQHLIETRAHVRALEALLERLPVGGISSFKDALGRLTASAQGVGSMLASDEVVRSTSAGYAFEHLEIATYRVLIAAADELSDSAAKAVFERILEEEIAMAHWLEANLDNVTRVFLMRDERDLQAKR